MLISPSTQLSAASSSDGDRSAANPESHDRNAGDELADTVSIDRHLRERILDRLAQRGIRVSDELTLDVYQRAVTVRGRVDSYYQRQLIIHSIRLVPGIGNLQDAVDVAPPADPRRFLCQPEPARSRQRGLIRAMALAAVAICLS
jgi:osmotically-inducible protein OsmY